MGRRARDRLRRGRPAKLESRNGNNITPRYPELRALGRALGAHEAILDGEVVALDAQGRPSFQRLQRRMHLTSEGMVRRLSQSEPVVYMIFDLLWLDGHSLMELTYDERRERLAELELSGPDLAGARAPRRQRCRAAGGLQGAGPGRPGGQAPRLPLRPRPPLGRAG